MLRTLKKNLIQYVQNEKNQHEKRRNFIVESSIYSDPSRFSEEMKALPNNNLGPLEEIKKSSDYLVSEDNGLQIFLNSCPHRGAHLNKTDKGFRCAYHGWMFNKNGQLEQSTGPHCPYPKGSLKLKSLPVTNVAGMTINDELTESIIEIKNQFQNFKYLEKRSHTVACNWKFLVESLLETYHFPFAHSPYLEGFENAFYSQHFQDGKNARIIVPLTNLENHQEQDNLEGINIMTFLFPYSFALHMSSGFVWFHITPESVGQSKFDIYLYAYDQNEESARQSLAMLNKILDQDFAILERQQVNTKHPQRYHFTGYEDLIKEFHRNISQGLVQL